MKQTLTLVCILVATLILEGCAAHGGYPAYYGHQRALAGTAMGTAGGALLGGAMTHDSDGALVGGLLGGAAGGLMGHSMDRAQRPPAYYEGGRQSYYGGRGYRPDYYEGERHHHRRQYDD